MTKLDFVQLIPDPEPVPATPRCEDTSAKRWTGSEYANRACTAKSAYRISGKHYCKRHAAKAALAYLRAQALE